MGEIIPVTVPLRVLGISGSPRARATDYCVQRALEEVSGQPGVTTDFISLAKHRVQPCNACNRCRDERLPCSIKDSMGQLIDRFVAADAYIIGSPVYIMGVTPQLQAFLTRTRQAAYLNPGCFVHKVGGALAVGGTRHGGQETAIQVIHGYYLAREVIVVGGEFRGYSGGTVWSHDAGAEGAAADVEGMSTVLGVARRVVHVARLVKLGLQATRAPTRLAAQPDSA